ncbi:MAG: hypothetical protein U5L45_13660 [Saprospiraceae bacterium]|nr:hypothetical protein [Saprospiraceae bacterium]
MVRFSGFARKTNHPSPPSAREKRARGKVFTIFYGTSFELKHDNYFSLKKSSSCSIKCFGLSYSLVFYTPSVFLPKMTCHCVCHLLKKWQI